MREEEHHIQVACVNWFRYQFPQYRTNLFAIPNGGHRHRVVASKLKAEGMTAGVSDLILMVARHDHHGLCIEMKTPKGRQSESQKAWEEVVTDAGYLYCIARSLDEFQSIINTYLIDAEH